MTGMPMAGAPRVLAVVQAGGQGARMDVLTRERAKPALPFAGTYQLIDIALSSISNSGVDDVWVSVQYMAGSLDRHLQSGRPWDLDRNRGGYRRIVPEEGRVQSGFVAGNADDLAKVSDDIEALAPDLVVVLSADQVFRLDLREVVTAHLERGSALTVVTTEVPLASARHKAVVTADATGRVRRVEEKPDQPEHGTISAEILVFSTAPLLASLQTVRLELESECPEPEKSGLGDLAEHLLPYLVEHELVHSFALPGYWKDMGRPSAFLGAHRDLVRGKVDVFDDPAWPVRSNQPDRVPARVRDGAEIADAVISPGCDIAGTVRRSTLGPGVRVEKGAVVEDCVVFADVVVEAGATVSTSILDRHVVVGRRAEVGVRAEGRLTDDKITLVGKDSRVGRGVTVPVGGRLEPGTTA